MKELQLTITLPSLQVTIPEGELDIQYLEKFVFQLVKMIGQHILTSILQFLDNQLRKERKRGELSNCGKRRKYLLTLLGNITYHKHLYQDQEGHYRCLLAETLKRKLTQTLSYNRKRKSQVSSLLGEGNIPEALMLLEEEKSKNPQKKDELHELMTYLVHNAEGIHTVDHLKEEGLPVDTMGAIEGNIDKILANRFKKRGMSWSTSGALNLAKVGQLIINDDWDNFWPTEEEVVPRQIEPKEFHLPQEDKYDRQYSLPVLVGPHQDRTWVKQLKELISIH